MSQRSGTWSWVGSRSLGVISQGCPCFLRASQLENLKENHPGFSVMVRGCTSVGCHSRCSLSKGTKSDVLKNPPQLRRVIKCCSEPWFLRSRNRSTQGQSNLGTQTLSYSSLLLSGKPCVSLSPFYIRRKVCLLLNILSYIFNHLIGFHYKILHAHNSFSSRLAGRLVPASQRWPLLCITSSLR